MFYFPACRGSPAGFVSSRVVEFAVQFIGVSFPSRASEVLQRHRFTSSFSHFPFSQRPIWNRREPWAALDACAMLPWRQWWHSALFLWRWWWLAPCKQSKSNKITFLQIKSVLHWIMAQLRNKDGRTRLDSAWYWWWDGLAAKKEGGKVM